MSIWLLFASILSTGAVPSAHRQRGTLDNVLHQSFGQRLAVATVAQATTTVPPALLHALAFREANLQEQIDRANQTLRESEKRLADILASMGNVTVSLKQLNATVDADKILMNGTSSIITDLNMHYSRAILEEGLNATKTKLAAINKTAQNISAVFGANKGAAPDTTDINKKFEDLKATVLLNGTEVAKVLHNFSKIEDVLQYNVSEWINISIEHQIDGVFDNISEKFAQLINGQAKSLKERPCDLVPNITNCKNRTNSTAAASTASASTASTASSSTASATGFLQVSSVATRKHQHSGGYSKPITSLQILGLFLFFGALFLGMISPREKESLSKEIQGSC